MRIFKFLPLLWLVFCNFSNAFAQENPLVVTSINPIYQIVLAITNDKNNTILIMKSGVDNHDWQMKKSDLEFVAKADLVFYVDDNLEKTFAKISNKKNNIYQISKLSQIKILQARGQNKNSDLHLWLNPENGVKFAEFAAQKLCELDSKNCGKYTKNLAIFKSDVLQTIKLIKNKITLTKNQNYIFYHDAYQYFEDYFALNSLPPISKNHESYLTVRNLREFDEVAAAKKIKCLFGDMIDEKNSAQKLAENYKIKFAKLDPLGDEKNSYPQILKNISEEIVGCLK